MPSSTARRRVMLWRKGVRQCARCGQALGGPEQATLEHIIPKSAGGRTTRINLSLAHAECNRLAGRALWFELRRDRTDRSPEKRPLTADFWYENLLDAEPSSRVPSPREPKFQLISAIESPVTIAEGSGIRERAELEERYGRGSWLKRKGQAIVRMENGTIRRAELHWYEAHGIGRRELRIKHYLDL